MSEYKELFQTNIDLSEDEVVMLIHDASAGEMTLKECQSEYRRLATEAGLIKTPKQRKVDWEDAVDGLDLSTPEGVAQAKAIGSDMEITPITINRYLKTLAEESGVTLPPTTSRSPSKWGEVVAAFTEDEALNEPREVVVNKINQVGEYDDEKKANSYYNRLRKEFGWVPPASMSSQLNDWFTENLEATKEDIIEKAIEIGMTEGSATYYVGVYKIAKELLDTLTEEA